MLAGRLTLLPKSHLVAAIRNSGHDTQWKGKVSGSLNIVVELVFERYVVLWF